tara:strand:- start:396 stop:962 length:567 start_codon:yes stop_codon:yes gene_type:complete
MLISERQLRQIIREELLKESFDSEAVLEEGIKSVFTRFLAGASLAASFAACGASVPSSRSIVPVETRSMQRQDRNVSKPSATDCMAGSCTFIPDETSSERINHSDTLESMINALENDERLINTLEMIMAFKFNLSSEESRNKATSWLQNELQEIKRSGNAFSGKARIWGILEMAKQYDRTGVLPENIN